jgi:hypothetical protein
MELPGDMRELGGAPHESSDPESTMVCPSHRLPTYGKAHSPN